MTAPAAVEPENLSGLDARWPLAADYPCCVPQCIVWRGSDGTWAWDHDHADTCPTQPSSP